MQFLILSASWWIVIAATSQSVVSSDISHSWQSLTFCSFGNLTNCLSRWRRIKIFDNLVSEIHPIIYMLGCGNNTFIVQTNCHFYLFFKEFLSFFLYFYISNFIIVLTEIICNSIYKILWKSDSPGQGRDKTEKKYLQWSTHDIRRDKETTNMRQAGRQETGDMN